MADLLAVVERVEGTPRSIVREVVAVARRLADGLGGSVAVAMPGSAPDPDARAGLAGAGANRIIALQATGVSEVAAALAGIADDFGAVVFAATGPGRDLAPRVAARLARPLATDVIEVELDGAEVVTTRPVFAGKALARVRIAGSPALLSIRPNVFAPAGGGAAADDLPVEELSPSEPDPRYRVVGFEAAKGASLDVAEAAIVVSGGRGMGGPEHWGVLEDLRDALGEEAALGASRAVVDAGWRPHAEQVGQTGKTVTPKLYFALAISGAIQHLAGMRTSGVIVAVNRDADAPIFGVADYGIVGDVFEVAPQLSAEVRRLRSG